jgi:hypothetical protein
VQDQLAGLEIGRHHLLSVQFETRRDFQGRSFKKALVFYKTEQGENFLTQGFVIAAGLTKKSIPLVRIPFQGGMV